MKPLLSLYIFSVSLLCSCTKAQPTDVHSEQSGTVGLPVIDGAIDSFHPPPSEPPPYTCEEAVLQANTFICARFEEFCPPTATVQVRATDVDVELHESIGCTDLQPHVCEATASSKGDMNPVCMKVDKVYGNQSPVIRMTCAAAYIAICDRPGMSTREFCYADTIRCKLSW